MTPDHPDPNPATPEPTAARGGTSVRFRGARGSIPSPGPTTARYGGNTPCLEVRVGDALLVLDAGTGIRSLGAELAAAGDPVRATILLTHFHWDHIQGLPFFIPMHLPSSRLEIVAPADKDGYVEDRLALQMQPVFFPVPFHGIRADCRFTAWCEGPLERMGIRIRAFPVRHPSRTVGYRIETPDASLCYIPDNELVGGRYDVPPDWRARLVAFVGDADLLVHDTMYTAAEYPSHQGWGHSTIDHALELARDAGVGHLMGFHHAPDRSDDALDALAETARAGSDGWTGRFSLAAEGQELHFPALEG